MTDAALAELLAHLQAHPESRDSLIELADVFLAEATSAAQRQQIRAVLADHSLRLACENLYFDGVDMEQPDQFARRILATLFMSGGYSSREMAQQIIGELRVFTAHHGVDFEAHMDAIRALPGARRSRARLRFLLLNAVIFLALILGLSLIQNAGSLEQLVLQVILFAVIVAAQLFLLYRYLR